MPWVIRIQTESVLLSENDTKHELLKDFDSPFVYVENLYPFLNKGLNRYKARDLTGSPTGY